MWKEEGAKELPYPYRVLIIVSENDYCPFEWKKEEFPNEKKIMRNYMIIRISKESQLNQHRSKHSRSEDGFSRI